MTRPLLREVAPAGYRYEPHPSTGWRVLSSLSVKRCRMQSGRNHAQCPNTAVAELNRRRYVSTGGYVDAWWAYCADHLYGHWIEDGVVVFWRLVPDTDGAP